MASPPPSHMSKPAKAPPSKPAFVKKDDSPVDLSAGVPKAEEPVPPPVAAATKLDSPLPVPRIAPAPSKKEAPASPTLAVAKKDVAQSPAEPVVDTVPEAERPAPPAQPFRARKFGMTDDKSLSPIATTIDEVRGRTNASMSFASHFRLARLMR